MTEDEPNGDASETPDEQQSAETLRRGAKRVETSKDLANQQQSTRNQLAGWYGWTLLGILAAQIIFADVVFLLYANSDEVEWDIDPVVMNVWLGATVVQIVGIATVVVRSLFPRQDS